MKVRLFNATTGDVYNFENETLAAVFISDMYGINLDYVAYALKKHCRRYKHFTIRYE